MAETRLTPLKPVSSRRRKWLFRCSCGTEITAFYRDWETGRKVSCGCARSANISASVTRHGAARRQTTTAEYRSWSNAKNRCYNPNNRSYARYGERGIRMCEKWINDFEAFLADMGPRPSANHSIDRIDVNGSYEPTNCRWADRRTQSRNRTSNRMVVFKGIEMPAAEVPRSVRVPYQTFLHRLDRGWSAEQAATIAPSLGNRIK